MNSKPAQFFVVVPKSDDAILFWKPFLGSVEQSDVNFTETDFGLLAGLSVKSYELSDHQYIRVKVNVKSKDKTEELVILLPRKHVVAIIESKHFKKEAFGFPQATS